MRVALATGLGVVLALAGVAALLTHRQTRLAGSNSLVSVSAVALPVPAGGERCAQHQDVPAGAVAVRVFAGTYKRPRGQPFSIDVRDGSRVLASGSVSGDFRDNTALRVPLGKIPRTQRDVTVCVRNRGVRQLGFAGNLTPFKGPRPQGVEVPRFDWLLADRPSNWDIAPRVASRWSLFRPGFAGSWTLWAVLGAAVLVAAASVRLLLRALPR
jgi:hypothetical protein